LSSRDARAYLHDIIEACDGIGMVIGEGGVEEYRADLRTRLATERELITVGEAVGRLAQVAPDTVVAWAVPVAPVVGLRNLLVHGYFKVDDARVFEIATEHVPRLRADAHRALQLLAAER
jgi:uncharacterized protein with HEPN domain